MHLLFVLFFVRTVFALSDANAEKSSALKEFLAGAVAGVTEILVTQPLVVASVRMKLIQNPPPLMALWSSIIRKEGVAGLYKGVAANIACVIPWRSVRFASYFILRNIFTGGSPNNATLFQQAISAIITGVFETFVITPFDVIQIAQIADQERIEPLYKGNVHCAKTIYKREGIVNGWYRGFAPTCVRQMIYVTTYLITYQYSKSTLLPVILSPLRFVLSDGVQTLVHLFSGMCAGLAGSSMNNPTDVVKTRMQREQVNHNSKITGTFQGLLYIAKTEGFWGLYSGIRPKYIKTGLGSAVFFVAYELVMSMLTR